MPGPDPKQRLDTLLVARGLAVTRSRARDLIKRGLVRVDNVVAGKPGQMVAVSSSCEISGDANRYVSRGAAKLIAGLDAFGFETKGRAALDVGASTGGFTQVLLERGAAHVWSVDVGWGQLDAALAGDPRVTVMEGTDARLLAPALVPEPITAIVADVSFISLTKALPAALALAAPGCWLVALVKPQFEAGPGAVGKGGIVRGDEVRRKAVEDVRDWLESRPGWRIEGVVDSPVEGRDGNREFLFGARFSA